MISDLCVAHSLIALCFDERIAVVRGRNCYSKLILISSGNQPGEREPATSVVGEPIDARVANSELTE